MRAVAARGGGGGEEPPPRLFEAWGVGQAEKDNGVLIVVAPTEREMRIEVGYGLSLIHISEPTRPY